MTPEIVGKCFMKAGFPLCRLLRALEFPRIRSRADDAKLLFLIVPAISAQCSTKSNCNAIKSMDTWQFKKSYTVLDPLHHFDNNAYSAADSKDEPVNHDTWDRWGTVPGKPFQGVHVCVFS